MMPAHDRTPKFWRNETGGELVPAVERYLRHEPLTIRDVVLLRAYLRQWIDSPAWDAYPGHDVEWRSELARLRASAAAIRTVRDINNWLTAAMDAGIDPL